MVENNNNCDDWCLRGLAYYRMGKYEDAIECYEKALEIDPNIEYAQLHKKRVLDMLKK